MAEKQVTTELTVEKCRAMIRRLAEANAELLAAIDDLERLNAKSIWVFKVPSFRVATEKLQPFVDELHKARLLLAEGRPQGPNSSKSRTSKTSKKKSLKRSAKRKA